MKTNSKTQITALLLAALLCGLLSCGTDAPDTQTSAADSTSPISADTQAAYTLPQKDFGGRNVHMYIWDRSKFDVTEENGDVMNDALYARNMKLQEMYNVTFSYDSRPGSSSYFAEWHEGIHSSIMAGEDEYQLVAGYGMRMAELSLSGSYHNLLENPNIDFTKEWWPQDYLAKANLGGNLPMAAGNLDLDFYDRNYVIFFNKQMHADLKLENPYELVKSGKWTLDRFAAFTTASAADLNGDTVIDENDRFGLSIGKNMPTDAFVFSCDIPMSDFDKNGMPYLLGLSERYVDLAAKLRTLYDDPSVICALEANIEHVFPTGHAYLEATRLEYALTYRDMQTDFGILPYPKFDEAQEEYHTFNSCGTSAGYLIPITADAELGGCILEAMAYYGYHDILPQYYEKALVGKGVRDDESAEMLDIILNGTYYDFTQIYGQCFNQNGPSYLLRKVLGQNLDITSTHASYQEMYDETMEKLIATLK